MCHATRIGSLVDALTPDEAFARRVLPLHFGVDAVARRIGRHLQRFVESFLLDLVEIVPLRKRCLVGRPNVPNEPRTAATRSHGPLDASAPFGC